MEALKLKEIPSQVQKKTASPDHLPESHSSASMKIIMFCQLGSVQFNSCTLGCKIHHNGYIEQGDTL